MRSWDCRLSPCVPVASWSGPSLVSVESSCSSHSPHHLWPMRNFYVCHEGVVCASELLSTVNPWWKPVYFSSLCFVTGWRGWGFCSHICEVLGQEQSYILQGREGCVRRALVNSEINSFLLLKGALYSLQPLTLRRVTETEPEAWAFPGVSQWLLDRAGAGTMGQCLPYIICCLLGQVIYLASTYFIKVQSLKQQSLKEIVV